MANFQLGFELAVSKSLIPNDTRLPNLRVNGNIKALQMTLSDRKIQSLTDIILSLPLPPPSLVDHATQVTKALKLQVLWWKSLNRDASGVGILSRLSVS